MLFFPNNDFHNSELAQKVDLSSSSSHYLLPNIAVVWKLDRKSITEVITKLKCRLVLFREPYRQFNDPQSNDLFCKLMNLKMTGYRRKHDARVLPIDGYDFLATHIAICVPVGQDLWKPINAYKSVSSQLTELHMQPFPAVSLLRTCRETQEAAQLESSLLKTIQSKEVFYNGSWTMDPAYKADEKIHQFLQEATLATLVQYYSTTQLFPVISAAVTRFRVDQWKETIGFDDIVGADHQVVTRFHSPIFSNSALRFMVLNQVSEEGLAHAQLYDELWRNRIEFNPLTIAQAA